MDADTWRLRVFGTGLRGSLTAQAPVEFSYRDLARMPAESLTAFIECAGNGRRFFASQQHQNVSGTARGRSASPAGAGSAWPPCCAGRG